jgi:translation initiation factor IF-3
MQQNKFDRHSSPFRNKVPHKNQPIYAKEVQLISSEGENLGVKTKEEAMSIAQSEELDLIAINPNITPPIYKVMDYSKYMYDKKKKQKNNKAKVKEQKELRFSPVIEKHDIDVRVLRAKKFLEKGHNVKLTIFRKGRQTLEQAKVVMDQLLEIFSEYNTLEGTPKSEGRKFFITIKAGKKKE